MAITGAVAAVAGLGATAYQGIETAKQGKKALRLQEEAQQQATNAAIQQQRQNDAAIRRANRKPPDMNALLASAQRPTSAPSLLTGPSGVDQSLLSLGQPKLLGH